jgi:hypothetical protein
MVFRAQPEDDFVARLRPLADREITAGIQDDIRSAALEILGEIPGPFLDDFRVHTEDSGDLAVVSRNRIAGTLRG